MSPAPPSVAGGAGVLHAPAKQVPEPQDAHAIPAPPHAPLSRPPWHAPVESQQPVHVVGPHAVPVMPVSEPPSSPVGAASLAASSPDGLAGALASSPKAPPPCPCRVLPPELPELLPLLPPLPPLLVPPRVPPDEAVPPPSVPLLGELSDGSPVEADAHAAQVTSARMAKRRASIALGVATGEFSRGAKVCHPGPVA